MTTTKDTSISFPIQSVGITIHSWEAQGGQTRTATFVASRTRTGTRLPKWRKVIAEGGNATTQLDAVWDRVDLGPALYSKVEMVRPGYSAQHTLKGDVGIINSVHTLGFVEPSLSTATADNLARGAFFKKLYSRETAFEGMIFLGELKETLRMLRHPAEALTRNIKDYVDALRKRKRSNPRNWRNDISSLWLEHAFGWVPLMSDIRNAYDAYEQIVTRKPKPVRISAGSRREYDRTSSLTTDNRPGYKGWTNLSMNFYVTGGRVTEVHVVRYRGAVRAQVEATKWDDAKLFGFSPTNFVPTVWELLPWSFLVDYFSNIGDILTSSVTSTRNLAYINKDVIRETSFDGRVETMRELPPGFQDPWVITNWIKGSQSWSLKRKRVSRTPNSGISMPQLTFTGDLSTGQLLNVAALLGQVNAGLHPQRYRR